MQEKCDQSPFFALALPRRKMQARDFLRLWPTEKRVLDEIAILQPYDRPKKSIPATQAPAANRPSLSSEARNLIARILNDENRAGKAPQTRSVALGNRAMVEGRFQPFRE